MNFRSTIGATLLVAATSLASNGAASAASVTTDAFLTNANQDIDFLDRSSRFALDNSKNAKVKAFAYEEARNQTLTANAIGDWIDADLAKQGIGDKVISGRSVALDTASPAARQLAAMSPRVGQEDLDNLEGLTGPSFDDVYKARQTLALEQLKELYGVYATSGDDPTLVAISKAELPKITRRLAELGRI